MDTSGIVSKPNIPIIDLEKEEQNRGTSDKNALDLSLVQSTSKGPENELERESFTFRRISRKSRRQKILEYFRIVLKNLPDPERQERRSNFKLDPSLMRFKLHGNALFANIERTMIFDPMEPIHQELENRRKKFRSIVSNDGSYEHRPRPSNSHHTLNVGSSDSSDEDSSLEPVCRPRAFRNEYFYINRNMNIFNLIRYSFASSISQNFLKTHDGQKQVKKAIDNCRNMVTKIIPEEEKAVASKILLISQQSIKQAKSSTHKFRNSRYHRQLNQGEKFIPLFFQTNFSFLKKGFEKNWFIEEQKISEAEKEHHLSNDHAYFRPPKKDRKDIDQKVQHIKSMVNAWKKLSIKLKQLRHKKQKPRLKDPILKLEVNLGRPGRSRLMIENSIKTKIVQDDGVGKNPKTIRTEPIKTFPIYDRYHRVPTDQLKSYESFRKLEKTFNEKKRESVNPFAAAGPYVKLHLTASKAGLADIDLSILHDDGKMKSLWLHLKTNPKLQQDPSMRDLLRMISNHMNNRTQWIRMESSLSKYQEDLGQMTESLKDNLPRNIFKVPIRAKRDKLLTIK